MNVRLQFSTLKFQFIWFTPFLLVLMSLLHGCSTPSVESPKDTTANRVTTEETPAPTTQLSRQAMLQADIRDAQQANNWARWLNLSESLWQEVDASQQLAIEYQIYQTLKDLPQETLQALQAEALLTHNSDMLDWLSFVEVQKRPKVWRNTGYEDLANFNSEGIFLQHLIPQLKLHQKAVLLPHKVAVLLPFKGPYAKISEQIRNGILKYQFAQAPKLTLAFYDSSDVNEVLKTSKQALQDGADTILGPLTKEAIAELSNQIDPTQAKQIWALNTVNNTPFKQMGFGSSTEALQIVQQLSYRGHKSISLLTSDAASDSKLAEQIQQAWLLLDENHQVTLNTFAEKRPNLRKALGDAINESQSQSRVNNLNWLLQEKLEFTPRPRQDLDALVVLSDAQTLAVFKPQMKFFELSLPLYASSKLTPTHFSDTPPLKDLQGVIFPTMSVAIASNPSENRVQTPFEAFGWDSLQTLLKQDSFAPDLCLNTGKTGRLYFDEDTQRVDRELVWATYNSKGKPIALPAPKPVYNIEDLVNPMPENALNSAQPIEQDPALKPVGNAPVQVIPINKRSSASF
ncbi:penicillin-binding protein activator [Thiosulfativibrio zosterae]|uniref:Penicillin-binding protein activator n=1 Tax=Thiosulfativibrio zosterae TaxID=2675053 RepID=A0A6F8PL42_9GAMM|nr:penicillin-binding protein activator [Thiosulfativibrio zosterae]BBP42767.1 hypothetical protein THMIRHAT_05130 [Thiosulfativibrio zosterae]